MALARRPDDVKSREDLFDFITDLAEEFETGNTAGWRNRTLPEYLDGMSSWLLAADGAYRNLKGTPVPEQPTWELVAWMLWAATDHE
ncbi:hypothetical protein SAMN05216188_11294 [Lentzea xinjiangensis]|uniref:DUF7660 domain-containing protein n=1 Tax=Lentzea xinjiangensis TaxID=402600 RepID=A0A1H9PV54_9PSEU|nr:hypothetical protein [Lentzea xinjiangensis]SER52107.1 hypothetical protein SAMN05216188_11294 [Lentzea xinjiangensis]